jgi:hypothetical protein
MFRIALSLYLILLAFAGPGLCYCNILQLTHQTVANNPGKNQPTRTKHRHPCDCKHQKKQHSAPVQPCSSDPSCPTCPCNHHEQIPVVLPSLDSVLNTFFDFARNLSAFDAVHSQSFAAQQLNDATPLANLSGWHQSQFSALGILRAPFVLLC